MFLLKETSVPLPCLISLLKHVGYFREESIPAFSWLWFIMLTQRVRKLNTFRWRRMETIFLLCRLWKRMEERNCQWNDDHKMRKDEVWSSPMKALTPHLEVQDEEMHTSFHLPADLLLITTVIEMLKQRFRVFVIGICPLSAVSEVDTCSFSHPNKVILMMSKCVLVRPN